MISKNQIKKMLTDLSKGGRTSNGKPINSRQNIESVYNSSKNCLGCSSSSEHIGIWMPDKDKVTSAVFEGQANPQQGRMIFYGLCHSCYGHPNRNERVEDKIIIRMSSQMN